ncbi:phosphatidylinositol 4-phosphate 5-kinase-like protein 1 isoform X2 [Ostrea edulis]|uniref:phosphatidylinositol 4-phosphate 5-kinase-like protein 1 isoform X2 n=1 Tax=Ostrea edulis TaxID=37623 RepID=UPI0024AF1B3F|nr:phosphatidylinositol 4-phosphate 5-kinase-like protein 1 isoform X2 [Ostrea edulis]
MSSPKRQLSKGLSNNKWMKLWKKWQRKDVTLVNENHRRHSALECIREGIRDLFDKHPELGIKDYLTEDDFCHVHSKKIRTKHGQKFRFRSYASSVFACIRRAVSVSDEDFLSSMAPEDGLEYLEFFSNSRSGQDFYLSHDQQFILKTDKKYHLEFFMTILGDYLMHFQNYPHSLIVKFLGLYSVNVSGQPKVYFLVMQNVFFPVERIEVRFDLKGCYGGRYQKPYSEEKGVLHVLKDQNFHCQSIDLGTQRDWFVRQLHNDVNFLRGLGVQDYSLLFGRHDLHVDDQQTTFGNLVTRLRKSFAKRQSSSILAARRGHNHVHPTDTIPEEADDSSGQTQEETNKTVTAVKQRTITRTSLGSLLESSSLNTDSANRRLLPECKNPLHVIDGTHERYYMGIIDFFTQYECKQQVARVLKVFKNCTGDHSTVPPDNYQVPKCEKMVYWRGTSATPGERARPKCLMSLELIDQFLATLMRLKVGLILSRPTSPGIFHI